MTVYEATLLALSFAHVSAVVVWVGAHFFEGLVLHPSLSRIAARTRLDIYPALFARLSRIRGLASASTLYSGVLLASEADLGGLWFMVTTPWGILSTLYFCVTFAGHLAGLRPGTVQYRAFRLTGTASLVAASLLVVAYTLVPSELDSLLHSSWGLAVLAGGLLAVVLSRLGVITGQARGRISHFARQTSDSGDLDSPEVERRLLSLEKKVWRLSLLEDGLIIVILVLMMYAGHPI